MRILILFFFICLITAPFDGQTQNAQKVKIVLMGVTHFANPGQDVINSKGDNMLAPKRQEEIEKMVSQLAAFGFDKVFIEAMPNQQARFDSLYSSDYENQVTKQADERRQVAFRLGKKLNLKTLYCVDAEGNWFFDSVMKFAQKNGQMPLMQSSLGMAKQYVASLDSLMLKSTLSSFINYLNYPEQLWVNHSLYNNVLAKIADMKNYPGPDLVGEWYKRNVRIYSQVMQKVSAGDKKVFLLFGQGHIYFLKQLFSANPDFEVVELKTVIK